MHGTTLGGTHRHSERLGSENVGTGMHSPSWHGPPHPPCPVNPHGASTIVVDVVDAAIVVVLVVTVVDVVEPQSGGAPALRPTSVPGSSLTMSLCWNAAQSR